MHVTRLPQRCLITNFTSETNIKSSKWNSVKCYKIVFRCNHLTTTKSRVWKTWHSKAGMSLGYVYVNQIIKALNYQTCDCTNISYVQLARISGQEMGEWIFFHRRISSLLHYFLHRKSVFGLLLCSISWRNRKRDRWISILPNNNW